MPKPSSKNISTKIKHFLVLDVGTTGIKAFVFRDDFSIKAKAYQKISKHVFGHGFVEQNPQEILAVSKQVLKEVVQASRTRLNHFVAFGLTNQRETVVAWDRVTGRPVYPAIVWEDRRTEKGVRGLKGTKGLERKIQEKTGLVLDSYFSASKIQWLLEHVPEAQLLLKEKRLLVGTIDTWLLWNLCEDEPHLTDETNAARTLLFNIKKRQWDEELLEIFNIPQEILPEVFSSGAHYGFLKKEIIGAALPVLVVAGDQQASTYAAGTKVGTTKVTYGTGAFLVQSLGKFFKIFPGFFTTLLPTVGGQPVFAVEVKVENCAASVEPVLKNSKKLLVALFKIAKKVDLVIKKLPNKPKIIIADGGVARDGIVVEQQSRISSLPVKAQITFDGTALGIVKLIADVLKRK